jgi:ketosteroid isomerase-like protein
MGIDPLSRLLAIEEIKRLKARYARLTDGKDWDALGELFTDDAVFEHPYLGSLSGRAAIVEIMSASIGEATFSHHVGMPEIDIDSDTEAHGIWSVIVQGQRQDATSSWVDDGRSEYHEEYRRDSDGRWRIARMTSVPMTRVSFPVSAPPSPEAATGRNNR